MHFDEEAAKISKDQFIDDVLKVINPKKIYCGEDYKFGMWAEGTPEYLSNYFDVFIHSFVCANGNKISTRDICALIEQGNVEEAAAQLGKPYRINGLVVEGLHNGAKFDFPTANLKLDYPYTFPKDGVYFGIADVYGVKHKAIISVGSHPTIMPLTKSIIEVHILDLDEDLYGRYMDVEFVEFIREIKKFDNIDKLKAQLEKAEDGTQKEAARVKVNGAKKALASCVGYVLLGLTMINIFDILRDLFRKRKDKYEDDEGNLTVKSFVVHSLEQLITNAAGLFVYADALIEPIMSIFTGEQYYAHELISVEAFNDVLDITSDTGTALKDFIAGYFDVKKNDGDAWQYIRES